MSTALLLFPDFALILLGFGIRRWMQLGDHFWNGLEKLVYFVLFPALLVSAIVRTRLDFAAAGPLLATALATMLAGMLLGALARPVLGLPAMRFASLFQCAFRFNSYIGLAAAGLLFGPPGIATLGLVLGVTVPLANLAAVWALARHGDAGLWREVGRNPLIWATLAGLLLNLAGAAPPAPVLMFLARLADASIALGLLAVGAALRFSEVGGLRLATTWFTAVKLLALPLVAVALGALAGLHGLNLKIAVLFAALPTASSAYILAMRMGGDGRGVAMLISISTLASMLTLPLWVAWLAGHA